MTVSMECGSWTILRWRQDDAKRVCRVRGSIITTNQCRMARLLDGPNGRAHAMDRRDTKSIETREGEIMNYKLSLERYIDYEAYIKALRRADFRENLFESNVEVEMHSNGSISAIKTWHDAEMRTGVACTIDRMVGSETGSDGKRIMTSGVNFYLYEGERDNHRTIFPEQPFDFSHHAQELLDLDIIDDDEPLE